MKTLRRPSRSAIRPPSSRNPPKASTYALISHASPSCESPRSLPIDGIATLTTEASSTTTNCAVARRASAHHLRCWAFC